jgi:putative hydrolase of the HAD superfamily
MICFFILEKKDAFLEIISKYNLKNILKEDLLKLYRNHYPSINLTLKMFIIKLKANGYKLGLITDGRSIQQRNKIKALNIEVF